MGRRATRSLDLTPAQRRIMWAILAGNVTALDLKKRLGLSKNTIRWQLNNMYDKTGTNRLAGLILWSLCHGFSLEEARASAAGSDQGEGVRSAYQPAALPLFGEWV